MIMIEYRSIQDLCDEIKIKYENYCFEIKRLKQEAEICEKNIEGRKRELENCGRNIEVRKLELENCEKNIEVRKRELENCEKNIEVRKRELETLDGEILLRRQELNRLRNEAEREIEQEKKAAYERMQKNLAYQQRKEEEERYLEEVRRDICRREKFEEGLCDDMRRVSGSFHSGMQDMVLELQKNMEHIVEKMQQETRAAVETMEKQTANAINVVVDTERKIRKDDFGDLLHNFTELQQLIFYNTPGGELGLEVTRIERYLKRFLKVLNRLGYEEYAPQIGEAYDEYLHIAEEREGEELPKTLDGYVVDGIVSCGFQKDGEICLPAKVTVMPEAHCGKSGCGSIGADERAESRERR